MTRCPYNLDKLCGSPPEPPAVPLEDVIFDALVGPLMRHLPTDLEAGSVAEDLTPHVARAIVEWQAGS